MPRPERKALIEELQELRSGALCVTYITSTRSGLEVQMADDILPLLYEHLESGKDRARDHGVDLFIHSNGGAGTVPWRIVSLVREYASKFAVLVPHRAFSAATLTALGADEIVMHRMGCLGPIDPSVANIFNPPNPQNPAQLAPISVEDVSAYLQLVKKEVGINHEDELIRALEALTDKIHPLALGNVQRHHQQSRLMAGKLLRRHQKPPEDHEIQILIDNLKSNLFFHGHPINRQEAKEDLQLKVVKADGTLEAAMWKLYECYAAELQLNVPFSPLHELDGLIEGPTAEEAIEQVHALLNAGLGQLSPDVIGQLAASLAGALKGQREKRLDLMLAFLESAGRSDTCKLDLLIKRKVVQTQHGFQDAVQQEQRWQRWETEI